MVLHRELQFDDTVNIDCCKKPTLRLCAGVASSISSAVVAWAIVQNLWFNKARARYPGRLVSFLGIPLFVLNTALASGWIFGNDEQLDYLSNTSEQYAQYWERACMIQGGVVQAALMVMPAYSVWICITFFNVIVVRHKPNLFRRDLKRSRNVYIELSMHAVIVMGSLGVAVATTVNGYMGPDTGVASCWLESRDHQWTYFYYFMAVSLTTGIVFSVVSTYRLWEVLSSVGAEDMWSERNRPLRRVVYGNVGWTIGVVACGSIPVIDILVDTMALCWLANFSMSLLGLGKSFCARGRNVRARKSSPTCILLINIDNKHR
jgi:hypothetical protein